MNSNREFELSPQTPEHKAKNQEIHERYSGRKATTDELLGDLEHVTTMGE